MDEFAPWLQSLVHKLEGAGLGAAEESPISVARQLSKAFRELVARFSNISDTTTPTTDVRINLANCLLFYPRATADQPAPPIPPYFITSGRKVQHGGALRLLGAFVGTDYEAMSEAVFLRIISK